MADLRSARRYWHTLRHLSAAQVLHRLRLTAQRRLYALVGRTVSARLTVRAARARAALRPGALLPGTADLARPPWPSDAAAALARVAAVMAGRFRFLGEERELSGVALWRCQEASQLWRYHAHYFAYAVDLGIAYRLQGDEKAYICFRDLVSSWLAHNSAGAPDAWHPYPLSLRLVNWLHAAQLFAPALQADPAFATRLARSLGAQARFLCRNLEYDVRGNHLIKNALALVVAGAGLADPAAPEWLSMGGRILEAEAAVQVLADGGHYERSPMYHSQVLLDCLQAVAALRSAAATVPPALTDAARRLCAFLQAIPHLDGEIPLLNDAAFDEALPPAPLLALGEAILDQRPAAPDSLWLRLLGGSAAPDGPEPATPPLFTALPDSGYWVFRPPGEYLIADCGEPCPPFLPAHAHCDLLSFEYGAAGQRILVDAGTFAYTAGPWRQYFRSTAAHNTVVINGREQHDAWASFRLGERSTLLSTASGASGGFAWFTGGYRLPGRGPVHRRLIAWVAGTGWLIADAISGEGPLQGEAWLHLHPDVAVQLEAGLGAAATLSAGGQTLRLLPGSGQRWELLPGGQEEPPSGWYAERFGQRRPAAALRLSARGAQRLRLACALVTAPGPATLLWRDDVLHLTLDGRSHRLRWQDDTVQLL